MIKNNSQVCYQSQKIKTAHIKHKIVRKLAKISKKCNNYNDLIIKRLTCTTTLSVISWTWSYKVNNYNNDNTKDILDEVEPIVAAIVVVEGTIEPVAVAAVGRNADDYP